MVLFETVDDQEWWCIFPASLRCPEQRPASLCYQGHNPGSSVGFKHRVAGMKLITRFRSE